MALFRCFRFLAFVPALFPTSCPHVQTGKIKIAPGKIMAAGHPSAAG
jgi:hypothetical protein